MRISTFAEEELRRQAKQNERFLETIRHFAPYRIEEVNRNALRSVLENARNSEVEMAKRFSEKMTAFAEQIIAPRLATDLSVLLASVAVAIHEDAFAFSAKAALAASVRRIVETQEQLASGTLASLRANLRTLDNAPVWAALHAMRTLKLERISPEFHEFIEETFEEIETQQEATEKTPDVVAQTATVGLSQDRQFRIMLCIAILQTFIAVFQLIQAGRPVRIDQAQLDEISKRYPEMSQALQLFSQASVSAYYEVERPVELKLKPTNRSVTIIRIEPGEPVRFLRGAHKWVKVEYQDKEEGLPVRGWVNKKYLSKQK